MTTIAAYYDTEKNEGAIVADGQTTVGQSLVISSDSRKLKRVPHPVPHDPRNEAGRFAVVGLAGETRFATEFLRGSPEATGDVHKLCDALADLGTRPRVRRPGDSESPSLLGLLVNDEGVFEIDRDLDPSPPLGYWAIGSGAFFAIGALCEMAGRSDLSPLDKCVRAVQTAATFDANSGGPRWCATSENDWHLRTVDTVFQGPRLHPGA